MGRKHQRIAFVLTAAWHVTSTAGFNSTSTAQAIGTDPGQEGVRPYTTSAAHGYHTDNSDMVGLLCIRDAMVRPPVHPGRHGEATCASGMP